MTVNSFIGKVLNLTTMKKGKYIWASGLITLFFLNFSLNAQFDDLYYDESEYDFDASYEDDYAYDEYDNDEYFAEADFDYDQDDYDEYLEYQDNGYDVDAYAYTNRFRDYRYSRFYNRYYSGGYFVDPFFANTWLGYNSRFNPYAYGGWNRFNFYRGGFGPSITLTFGLNPYRDVYGFGFNRFNRFNRWNTGFGFGGGFSRIGGFGAGGYACPPYIPTARFTNPGRVNNTAVTSRNVTSQSRRSGSTITSTRRTTRTVNNTKATSTNRSTRVSPRSSSRTTTRTSSRTTRTSPSSRTSSRSSSRSYTPSRSSSRSSGTRSSSRSYTPSRSSSRSSGARSSSSSRSSGSSSRSSSRRGGTE